MPYCPIPRRKTDPPGTDVQVADLGIAHLPLGQADVAALGVDQGVRRGLQQGVPVRQVGLGERVVGGLLAVAPAVEDQQHHRPDGNGRDRGRNVGRVRARGRCRHVGIL